MDMISNRPYLLRAFYDWIVDSQCTPVLVADAKHPRCKIPEEYVQDNEIVFNISPTAVRDLDISNDWVQFRASFHGVVHVTSIPIGAVLALYADENNEGIFFDGTEEELGSDIEAPANYAFSPLNKSYQEEPAIVSHSSSDREQVKGKPSLRIVEVE
jgi:stringent starvation protein B